jgi:hypothetical protein
MALTKVTGELVDIGDLDISNVGSIQLDSIAGDADSNTSITFSGSDVITVATGGSTAATFNADQTTTFSGAISGTSATLTTADNTAQLTLISTDADANQGPILDLNRNPGEAGADNDYLGQIYWTGHNDAGTPEDIVYAKLTSQILDASDGTEDANMVAYVMKGGSRKDVMRLGPTEAVINEGSEDIDFRVESDGNANMLFVDAGNDRVGIGEGSPAKQLHISAGSPVIRLEDTDGGYAEVSGSGGNLILRADEGASESSSHIRFEIDDSAKMRLTGDGYLGIGTISPEGALDVNVGTAGVWTGVFENTASGGAGVLIKSTGDTGSENVLDVRNGTGTIFKVAQAGATVTIGNGQIADPKLVIDSASGGDPTLIFDTSQANRTGIIQYKDQGTVIGFIKYEHNGDKLNFGAGSSTGVTMTVNDGKVGIGNTSPGHNLNVTGTSGVYIQKNTTSSAQTTITIQVIQMLGI